MAKSKNKRNKSRSESLAKRHRENVRRVMRNIWIRMLSFQTNPDLNTESPFSGTRINYETASLLKHATNSVHHQEKLKKAIAFNSESKKVADEAINTVMTRPQPWPYVVVALQSDQGKVWYDHIVNIPDIDYMSNSKEYMAMVDNHRRECVKGVNPRWLIAVGIYVFNDRHLDFNAIVPQIVDDMIEKGALDNLTALLGAQANIKDTAPDFYEEIKDKDFFYNVGELLVKYYTSK